MDWIAATIGAVGSLANTGLGSALAYSSDKAAAKRNYEYSLKLQQAAQKWQEHMSNTAHQREVKDLRAAGLNPILSAGGSGASFSNASGASVNSPSTVSNAIDNDGFLNAVRLGIEGDKADSTAKQADAALTQAKVSEASQKSQEALNNASEALNLEKIKTEKKNQAYLDAKAKQTQAQTIQKYPLGNAVSAIDRGVQNLSKNPSAYIPPLKKPVQPTPRSELNFRKHFKQGIKENKYKVFSPSQLAPNSAKSRLELKQKINSNPHSGVFASPEHFINHYMKGKK